MERLIAIAIWAFFWACCGALAAASKRRHATGAALGILLGPLGVIIALFLRPAASCPWCKSVLAAADATVCATCGRDLVAPPATPPVADPDIQHLQAIADARARQ